VEEEKWQRENVYLRLQRALNGSLQRELNSALSCGRGGIMKGKTSDGERNVLRLCTLILACQKGNNSSKGGKRKEQNLPSGKDSDLFE